MSAARCHAEGIAGIQRQHFECPKGMGGSQRTTGHARNDSGGCLANDRCDMPGMFKSDRRTFFINRGWAVNIVYSFPETGQKQ